VLLRAGVRREAASRHEMDEEFRERVSEREVLGRQFDGRDVSMTVRIVF
jgi:hypothetical protein